jgi:hypothetical protein
MQIYVHRDNQQLGPFTEAEIRAQLASGAISLQDHVWWQGQVNWIQLGQSSLVASSGAVTSATPPAPASAPLPAGSMPTTSSLAIWSLVCACLSLVCGILSAVPAIILGHLALGDIKRTPGRAGRGMAIAGLVIGYILAIFYLVVIACYMMFLPQILKMVKDQQQLLAVPQLTNSPDETLTNSDSTTNAPDQNTPAGNPTNSPDSSTNGTTTTSTSDDATTNAATPDTNGTNGTNGTNSPGATPMNP